MIEYPTNTHLLRLQAVTVIMENACFADTSGSELFQVVTGGTTNPHLQTGNR